MESLSGLAGYTGRDIMTLMLDLIGLLMWLSLGGVVSGEATYYHPSLHGGIMRNGEVYNEMDAETVAVGIDPMGNPILPLGSRLLVCTETKCIKVTARDTGLFPTKDLDLSKAAFASLDVLAKGRLKIQWKLLPKERWNDEKNTSRTSRPMESRNQASALQQLFSCWGYRGKR